MAAGEVARPAALLARRCRAIDHPACPSQRMVIRVGPAAHLVGDESVHVLDPPASVSFLALFKANVAQGLHAGGQSSLKPRLQCTCPPSGRHRQRGGGMHLMPAASAWKIEQSRHCLPSTPYHHRFQHCSAALHGLLQKASCRQRNLVACCSPVVQHSSAMVPAARLAAGPAHGAAAMLRTSLAGASQLRVAAVPRHSARIGRLSAHSIVSQARKGLSELLSLGNK